jgi:hypothetical protein
MKRRIKLGDVEQAAVCLMALSRCFVSPEKITIATFSRYSKAMIIIQY